jgi:hypothetical protein
LRVTPKWLRPIGEDLAMAEKPLGLSARVRAGMFVAETHFEI